MFRLCMLILSGMVAAILIKTTVVPTVERFNQVTCTLDSEVCQ